MTFPKLTFIGAGNMAQALTGGLLAKGWPAANLTLTDLNTDLLESLTQRLGVNTSQDNSAAVSEADIVVLAVKPQVLEPVCLALASALPANVLVVSIAAGIPTARLSEWLGEVALVRVMPNTPALVASGASGLFANAQVTAAQRQQATGILESAGLALWFETEDKLDAVTAVSGSGPAYFFRLMEAMIDAGEQLGLSADSARQLVLQTALGAATLASQSDDAPGRLREKVTSPGGTTAAALDVFSKHDFGAMVAEALAAAKQRSLELSGN